MKIDTTGWTPEEIRDEATFLRQRAGESLVALGECQESADAEALASAWESAAEESAAPNPPHSKPPHH